MEDELNARLQAWQVPAMSDGLDERLERLLVSPLELHGSAPRYVWWPALVFGGAVAALVASTALVVSLTEPRVPTDEPTRRHADAVTGIVTARLGEGRARNDGGATSWVPFISRVVLDGYVPLGDSQLVVERRSR